MVICISEYYKNPEKARSKLAFQKFRFKVTNAICGSAMSSGAVSSVATWLLKAASVVFLVFFFDRAKSLNIRQTLRAR
jgi:hypothetical protein